MIMDFYNKLSDKERKVFYAAVAVLILALFDAFFLRPVMTRLGEIDREVKEKRVMIKRDLRFISYKNKIFKEDEAFKIYKSGEDKTGEEIIAAFLKTVETIATQTEINLVKLNPSDIAEKKGFVIYYANLEGGGPLKNVVRFMYEIDMTDNLLKIVKFNMEGNKASQEDVKISMKIGKLVIDPRTIGNYEFEGDDLGLPVITSDNAQEVLEQIAKAPEQQETRMNDGIGRMSSGRGSSGGQGDGSPGRGGAAGSGGTGSGSVSDGRGVGGTGASAAGGRGAEGSSTVSSGGGGSGGSGGAAGASGRAGSSGEGTSGGAAGASDRAGSSGGGRGGGTAGASGRAGSSGNGSGEAFGQSGYSDSGSAGSGGGSGSGGRGSAGQGSGGGTSEGGRDASKDLYLGGTPSSGRTQDGSRDRTDERKARPADETPEEPKKPVKQNKLSKTLKKTKEGGRVRVDSLDTLWEKFIGKFFGGDDEENDGDDEYQGEPPPVEGGNIWERKINR
ncbi:MAG: hypothetical protein ACLFPX_04030 [Candidatus Omnitrophota bacterium]